MKTSRVAVKLNTEELAWFVRGSSMPCSWSSRQPQSSWPAGSNFG